MVGRAAVAVVIALLTTGCGDDRRAGDANRARATITISAVLTPSRVTVSPSSCSAGTIALRVSNQTSSPRSVELRSGRLTAGGSPLVQRTGSIPTGGTSTLTATVDEGSFRVSAPGSGIASATIAVGPPKANAIDRLLQP